MPDQVPPALSNETPSDGSPGPNRRSASPGERRVVTILFCDVASSTAMAERLDPEEWAELMDEAFDYLTAPVERYGGTVARLMGDGILAFFGAPVAHEDDPERAVLAGLDIVAGLRPFQASVRQETGLDFNIRVGINTGPVVVGEVGSQSAGEYTAMGDAVNLAARMQANANPGTVQVAENTYRLIATLFDCNPLGEIQVKGKNEPVMAYQVIGRKAQPGRQRGIPGLHAPLIGREREMNLLRQGVTDLKQGRGGIITLIAEAGLGKSRLVQELHALALEETSGIGDEMGQGDLPSSVIGRAPPIIWFESHGVSYDTQRPYGLFRQQLRQSCGVSLSDPPEIAREKIMRSMQTAPFAGSPELERIENTAQILLSVETSPDGLQASGEAFKRELFDVLLTVYGVTAEKAPLVVVCDDLHWADPASVELLMHLFQLVDSHPILFLCCFRPYRNSPGWSVKPYAETNYPHVYQEIQLFPLTNAESDQLVENLLAISRLPEKLRQAILEKAEGNPFFVEEVVRTLIERNAVTRDKSGLHWQVTGGLVELTLPDNLQALLIARVDRLDADVRQTLQLAAVIGRRFPYRLLKEVSPANGTLDRHLASLQRAELVHEVGRVPELEYSFHHELTRDAAYETILHRQRRRLHRQVGEALERFSADRLEQEANRLAYHFKEGRDPERALKYYTLAGDAALRLYANQEAAAFYREALDLTQPETEEETLAYLFARRGRALELSGEYELALENYQEQAGLARARTSQKLELAALLPQATIFSTPTSQQDAQRGHELSLLTLGLARELQDFRAEVRALWNLMLIESFKNRDPKEGIGYGETALELARAHNLREELAYTLHDLFRLYALDGRNDQAWAVLREAQELWRELGELPMLADSYSTAADALALAGDYDQAFESAQEALRISRSINSAWGQAFSYYMLGPIYLERGEVAEAIDAIHEAISLAHRANFGVPLVTGPIYLAWLYLSFGRNQDGAQMIQQALAGIEKVALLRPFELIFQAMLAFSQGEVGRAGRIILDEVEQARAVAVDVFFGPLAAMVVGEILLANKAYDVVLDLCERAQEKMRFIDVHMYLPDLLFQQGRALLGEGQVQPGEEKMVAALEEARRQVSRRSLWPVLAELARLSAQRGDIDQAQAFRREGQAVIGFIREHLRSAELREAFFRLRDILELMGEIKPAGEVEPDLDETGERKV